MEKDRLGLLYAIAAVFFFSTSAVLVRFSAPLSTYQISCGRLVVGSAAILLLGFLRREHRWPARADWPRFIVYGAITAAHFVFYVAAILYTTLAHALTLVYTAPIWVALLSAWRLKEPLRPRQYAGMLVTLAGLGVMVGFEPQMSRQMIIGDLLALASAVMFALYTIAGRSQRQRYPLFTYAGLVYGLAALWLAPLAAATTHSVPGWPQVLAVIGLGLIPMAAGHTLYNAAVRHTHAAYANLIATQEVTGGVLLGILLLGEVPGPTTVIGLAVTLVGIALVLR
ncbi:MAG: DMT family transporter [Anaerolineae bacterium]|nr:DMT family transporter [Anaerolineae bacterium]